MALNSKLKKYHNKSREREAVENRTKLSILAPVTALFPAFQTGVPHIFILYQAPQIM